MHIANTSESDWFRIIAEESIFIHPKTWNALKKKVSRCIEVGTEKKLTNESTYLNSNFLYS